MGRQLGENVINLLRIRDTVSDSVLEIYYKVPDTEMRVRYFTSMFDREPEKAKEKSVMTRKTFGLEVMTGFKKGSFERKEGEIWIPISTDPEDPHYLPDWKDWLQKYAPDILEEISFHVFEKLRVEGVQEYDQKN